MCAPVTQSNIVFVLNVCAVVCERGGRLSTLVCNAGWNLHSPCALKKSKKPPSMLKITYVQACHAAPCDGSEKETSSRLINLQMFQLHHSILHVKKILKEKYVLAQ